MKKHIRVHIAYLKVRGALLFTSDAVQSHVELTSLPEIGGTQGGVSLSGKFELRGCFLWRCLVGGQELQLTTPSQIQHVALQRKTVSLPF